MGEWKGEALSQGQSWGEVVPWVMAKLSKKPAAPLALWSHLQKSPLSLDHLRPDFPPQEPQLGPTVGDPLHRPALACQPACHSHCPPWTQPHWFWFWLVQRGPRKKNEALDWVILWTQRPPAKAQDMWEILHEEFLLWDEVKEVSFKSGSEHKIQREDKSHTDEDK